MPKNVNLNHFSMWRSEKKIVGLSLDIAHPCLPLLALALACFCSPCLGVQKKATNCGPEKKATYRRQIAVQHIAVPKKVIYRRQIYTIVVKMPSICGTQPVADFWGNHVNLSSVCGNLGSLEPLASNRSF